MLSTLPPEAAGLVAVLALVLLPGLLVVRAPWTAVPALSIAFWTLSWWWLPLGSRTRTLTGGLVMFAVLAGLRLVPRHAVPPPPGYTGPPSPPPVTGPLTARPPRLRAWPSLGVVLVALALLAPIALFEHVPGREMAFHTTTARAAIWRDARPLTYQPLLPLEPFGAHGPALGSLAADTSLLSGLAPGRAVALATLAAAALLLLALFALLAVHLPPPAAALAALLGLAAVRWPGFFEAWGQGGPILALGLVVPAATLLLAHRSRASAAAAGMLLGAALLAQPLLAILSAGVIAALSGSPRERGRLGLAGVVAVVLAAPGLWPVARALSAREAWGIVSSIRGAEVIDFLIGLALVGLTALLAARLAGTRARGGTRTRACTLTVAGAILLVVRVTVGLGAGQIDPLTLQKIEALQSQVHPLEAVCAAEAVIDWVPALGGRPPGVLPSGAPRPWVPHPLREEWQRQPLRPCSRKLD